MENNDAKNKLPDTKSEASSAKFQAVPAKHDATKQFDLSREFEQQDEIRIGIITQISDTEIKVNIGTKLEGIISGRELEQLPTKERETFTIGEQIRVYVLTPEDSES